MTVSQKEIFGCLTEGTQKIFTDIIDPKIMLYGYYKISSISINNNSNLFYNLAISIIRNTESAREKYISFYVADTNFLLAGPLHPLYEGEAKLKEIKQELLDHYNLNKISSATAKYVGKVTSSKKATEDARILSATITASRATRTPKPRKPKEDAV